MIKNFVISFFVIIILIISIFFIWQGFVFFGEKKFDNICLNPLNKPFISFLINSPDQNTLNEIPASKKCRDQINDNYNIPSNTIGFAIESDLAYKINQYDNSCDKYCYFYSPIVNIQMPTTHGSAYNKTWNGVINSFEDNNQTLLKYNNSILANIGEKNIKFSCSAIDCSLKIIKHQKKNYLLLNFRNINNLESMTINSNYSFLR